jgi:hypothetical protein
VSPDVESRAIVDWPAIARGALVGLGLIIPITILDAILDRRIDDFEDSGWRVLIALLIMAAFIPAGAYAARFTPNAPLTNGALAGLGAFAVWIPFRVLIWLTRDDNRGLVSGNDPVLRPGQIFGFLVISTALGMVGGYLASRRQRPDDARS